MSKLTLILISIAFFSACVQGEAEINKRQLRQIDKLVEYKLDSFKKAQEAICYSQVLDAAQLRADSVIAIFIKEAAIDTLNRPDKPIKPEKPEVVIPEFED